MRCLLCPVCLVPLAAFTSFPPRTQLSSALAELEEVTEEHRTLTSTHRQLLQTSQTQLSSASRQSVS